MRLRAGTHAVRPAHITLTPRQEEVMRLLRRGLTNAQIADTLGITLDGAKFHVGEIIQKLGANSREEAVALWEQRPRFSWPAFSIMPSLKVAGLCAAVLAGVGAVALWAALLRSGSNTDAEGAATPVGAGIPETSTVVTSSGESDMALVACPTFVPRTPQTNQAIDWVDFVNFEGIRYMAATWGGPHRTVDVAALRAPHARVQVNVSETAVDAFSGRADCEAAYLPAGTILYEIDGFDPDFRIATREGKLYEAYHKAGAVTAGEFIDIAARVEEVVIWDGEASLEVARIADPATLDVLSRDVQSARVDDSTAPGTDVRYTLEFRLRDGPAWSATFWPQENRLWPGIFVSDAFTETILAAIP